MESTFPIYGITVNQLKKLSTECGISSVAELLEKGRTPEKRQKIANKIDVDRKSVDLWVKQADLLRVDGMTSEYAYFLVHAGIRSIEDLAKININTTKNALQAAVNAHPILEYEVEEDMNSRLGNLPIEPKLTIESGKGIFVNNAQETQEYLVGEFSVIPNNWKDAKSISKGNGQEILFSKEYKKQKTTYIVYTRYKNGLDTLLSYGWVCSELVDQFRMDFDKHYIRMKIGEITPISIFAKGRDEITLIPTSKEFIEIYEDESCTKLAKGTYNTPKMIVYAKALKQNPCATLYLADCNFSLPILYQILDDNPKYEIMHYTNKAPEITDTDLMIMKSSAIKLNPSSLVMNNLGLIYQDLPQEIVETLKDKVRGANIDVSDEIEPSYLFDYDYILEVLDKKSEREVINEGLNSLREINVSLPLPRYFSGQVRYRLKDENGCHESTSVANLLVEVSGITTTNQDDNIILSSYTDSTGKFTIKLPPEYCMQECITFTFKQGGYKQSFNINASDIVADSVIYNIDADNKNKLTPAEIIDRFEKIDDLNNEISTTVFEMQIVDLIQDFENNIYTQQSQITELTDSLKNTNLADSETLVVQNKIDAHKKDVEKKKLLIEKLKARLNTSETTIEKIKKDYNDKLNSLRNERRDLIVLVFSYDPTESTIPNSSNENDVDSKSTISYLMSLIKMAWRYGIDDDSEGFVIVDEIFKGLKDDYSRALPSVKLMGEGDKAVWLPTDRAPSRTYNYSLLQRLVEPSVDPPAGTVQNTINGYNDIKPTANQRVKLIHPIDVTNFKTKFSKNTNDYPKMSSLGMGYSLNMHQAWIPDGFALGELLYSLILAPGEEQRLVVREQSQSYEISDYSTGEDSTTTSQSQTQSDNIQALYDYVVNQMMDASSDYKFSSDSGAFGGSLGGGVGGVGQSLFGAIAGALTGGYSRTTGKGSSHARQTNNHNEASQASQSFNQKFAAASSLLAQSRRVSIRSATSNESDSVATKIIANHNHSHAMTVQYWEVVRRYRLETCIEGIDLLLFVPLNPICFLPDGDPDSYELDLSNIYGSSNNNGKQTGSVDNLQILKNKKENFNKRYERIMLHYNTIRSVLPYKYRGGLDLIQKYYSLPFFNVDTADFDNTSNDYSIIVTGNFCDFDKLSATIYFNNGSNPVTGFVDLMSTNTLRFTDYDGKKKKPHNRMEVLQAISEVRIKGIEQVANIKFQLPYGCTKDNISRLVIKNNIVSNWKYPLCQDRALLSESEKSAISNYETWMNYKYEDTNAPDKDQIHIDDFKEGLPEWYFDAIASFSSNELQSRGSLNIKVYEGVYNTEDIISDTDSFKSIVSAVSQIIKSDFLNKQTQLISSTPLGTNSVIHNYDNGCPRISLKDVQKMEETFHHIVTENLRYSKAIWQSLTTDELAMMLEQYTVDMDFDNYFDISSESDLDEDQEKDQSIPLLNCINVKKPMGFYGNCMLFPFTYPDKLAKKLGKTAAEIQDDLYRYHASNFRSPSTVISVPTEGMIGEAVLGATNVSEKIDITRFWNWKDSPIDSMEITNDYLNNTDYLKDKNTKDITSLNLQKADSINPTEASDLISALVNRQTPSFNDITGLDQLSSILTKSIDTTATGRDNAINQSASLSNKAMDYLMKVLETEAEKHKSDNEVKKAQKPENKNPNGKDPNGQNADNKPAGSSDSNTLQSVLTVAILAMLKQMFPEIKSDADSNDSKDKENKGTKDRKNSKDHKGDKDDTENKDDKDNKDKSECVCPE